MTTPVEVHFHGIAKSEAIELRVREKVAKLAKHFERMTSCRVGIEVPQRNAQTAKVYLIKIEIGMPRRRPIVIKHEREGSHAHEEIGVALREAFEVARRKMDDTAAKIGQRSKIDRGRRRPRPAMTST